MMLSFSVRTLIATFWLVWWGWVVSAEAPRWELAQGTLDATELESQECYFQIGDHATVAFHPKHVSCDIARNELRGKRVKLVAIVEPQ